MGLILDTNVIIDCHKGLFDLTRIPTSEGRYFLPYIVLSEYLVGQYRVTDPNDIASINRYAEMLRNTVPSVSFNYSCAQVHASLFNHAKSSGKSSGKNAHDIIIASIAIAYGFKVVTRNVRDFAGIPDLDVIDTSTL